MKTTSTQLCIYLMIARQWGERTGTDMPNLEKIIKFLLEMPNETEIMIEKMPF